MKLLLGAVDTAWKSLPVARVAAIITGYRLKAKFFAGLCFAVLSGIESAEHGPQFDLRAMFMGLMLQNRLISSPFRQEISIPQT